MTTTLERMAGREWSYDPYPIAHKVWYLCDLLRIEKLSFSFDSETYGLLRMPSPYPRPYDLYSKDGESINDLHHPTYFYLLSEAVDRDLGSIHIEYLPDEHRVIPRWCVP